MRSIFLLFFFPKFLFTFTFYKFFDFRHPENDSLAKKIDKNNSVAITLRLFLHLYQVSGFHLLKLENYCYHTLQNHSLYPYLKPIITCHLKPVITCHLEPVITCHLKPVITCHLKPVITSVIGRKVLAVC